MDYTDLIEKLDNLSHETYILQRSIKEKFGDDNIALLAASAIYNFSNQLDDIVNLMSEQ